MAWTQPHVERVADHLAARDTPLRTRSGTAPSRATSPRTRTSAAPSRAVLSSQRISRCALLVALALAIAALESLVSLPAPVPGMKLGLANIVTVVAAFWLGPAEAILVFAVRVVLGSALTGQLAALPFSLAGGTCALAVTLAFARNANPGRIRLCSMAAAVAHNAGQLAVAVALTATPQLAYYLPVLLAVGLLTGFLTGTVAQAVFERVPKAA